MQIIHSNRLNSVVYQISSTIRIQYPISIQFINIRQKRQYLLKDDLFFNSFHEGIRNKIIGKLVGSQATMGYQKLIEAKNGLMLLCLQY